MMSREGDSSDKRGGIARRTFLKQAACIPATLAATSCVSSERKAGMTASLQGEPQNSGRERPNVLFVFADQLRSHDIGCYGGNQISTPNIDRLASEGVRFTHATSTYPICSPYRAMMLTGLYPVHNGMVCNDHRLRPDVTSFAESFRQAGYHTGYIGKWHVDGRGRESYIPPERRLGFEHWMALECTHDYFNSPYYEGDSPEIQLWQGYDAIAQTRAAQDYIRERAGEDEPFALFVSWGPPHDPYIAPSAYMERVRAEDVALRPNAEERDIAKALLDHPRFRLPEEYRQGREQALAWVNDDEEVKKSLAGYLAATLLLDDCIGDLLGTLEEKGILDNTLVVFTSDHGDCLGSHRFYGKDSPFIESISVPFLVRYPSAIPSGTVTGNLLGPIDIMPTVLSLAGVPCPPVDGLDLAQAAMGANEGLQDAVLLHFMTHVANASIRNGMASYRGVRTNRYTYARYEDRSAWLLFDDIEDPYQMRNLASDSKYSAILKELNLLTDDLLGKADDPEDERLIVDMVRQINPNHSVLELLVAANSDRWL